MFVDKKRLLGIFLNLVFLTSCGADPFENKVNKVTSGTSSSSSIGDNNQNLCICTMDYTPVCGVDKKTYSNSCQANCAGVGIDYAGECQ